MLGAGAQRALSKRTAVYLDLAWKQFPDERVVVYWLGASHGF